jgi:hypothetical protein
MQTFNPAHVTALRTKVEVAKVEASRLRDKLLAIDPSLADDPDFDEMIRNETSFDTVQKEAEWVIGRLARIYNLRTAYAKAVDAEIAELETRKSAHKIAAVKAKASIAAVLTMARIAKVKDGVVSVFTRSNKPKLVIDQDKLPPALWIVEVIEKRSPNADAIQKALAAGKKVPGAAIVDQPDSVVIR